MFGRKCIVAVICLCLLALPASILLTGCGSSRSVYSKYPRSGKSYVINGQRYHILASSEGFAERGDASWYGGRFHGRKTASGEIYNMYDMTAAHKVLPLGTYVKVTNLRNRRSTTVRINDRGPFLRGRVIDLSYASAKELGIIGPGIAPVHVEALGRPERQEVDGRVETVLVQPRSYSEGSFAVQVASMQDRRNAEILAAKLKKEYGASSIVTFDRGDAVFYRVQVADAPTIGRAMELQTLLEGRGYRDCFVVAR